MADNVDAALMAYLRLHASFLYFMFDKDGKIIKTNQFTSKLVGRQLIGEPFQSVFVDFCELGGPSGFFTPEKKDGFFPLSVKVGDGFPRTFYFMFFDLGDVRVAFGDQNYDELDMLQKKFLELNSELGNLTRELQKKNIELEGALKKVKTLEGILPLCANCKKIRLEGADPRYQASWLGMENYIEGRTDAQFSHGLCPECQEKLYPRR